MNVQPYTYSREESHEFLFISEGKKRIAKKVKFSQIDDNHLHNLSFGDVLPDGSIDDSTTSNNGDLKRIISTVIDITRYFTQKNKKALISFKGSSEIRTRLYERVLRTYYFTLTKEFLIYGLTGQYPDIQIHPFLPNSDAYFNAFLIKRII